MLNYIEFLVRAYIFYINTLEGQHALYINYRYMYVLSYFYNNLYIKICYMHVKQLILSEKKRFFF